MPYVTNLCCGGAGDVPAGGHQLTPHLPACVHVEHNWLWVCDCPGPTCEVYCTGQFLPPKVARDIQTARGAS